MLISELRGVAGNVPDVYRGLRDRAADYKIAVLKTASNFQYFAPITSQVIRVDTRGPGQSDIADAAVAADAAPDLSARSDRRLAQRPRAVRGSGGKKERRVNRRT